MFAFLLQVFGGVFLALILLVIVAILWDKRKKQKEAEEAKKKEEEFERELADLESEIANEATKIHQYNPEELQVALSELNALEGLAEIKNEVNELVKVAKYELEEGEFDHKAITLHYVFTGNPGTGKTTVARLLAQIYKAMGVLSTGQLVEVDRSGLVAGYIGQTAQLTKSKIEAAIGGVLFIDEAYGLAGKGENDFGKEAIDTILKFMEDYKGEFMVIVAGYDKPMETFLSSNPGLRSRFDKKFNFEDYDLTALMSILKNMFKGKGKALTEEAENHIREYLEFRIKSQKGDFGNARESRKIVLEALKNQKLRMADIPTEERKNISKELITLEDVAEFNSEALKSNDNERRPIGYDYDGQDE